MNDENTRRPGRKRSWVDGVKPKPARVVVDGTPRFFGVTAAAKWLGCTPPALSAILRNVPGRGERLRDRALREFPELFETNTKKGKAGQ